MEHRQIGFTAPSSSYLGATISLECNRYFDGLRPAGVAWALNVFAQVGEWVDHPDSDVLEETTDEMLARLSSFYDGFTEWTLDGTEEKLTLWQMLLRSLPENIPG